MTEGSQNQSFIWGNGLIAAGGEEQFYYLQDHLGSPIRLMGEEQGDTPLAYDEFGVPLAGTGQNVNNPFGFTGYQADDVSGMYYAQARYYEPGLGRFIASDMHWNEKNMQFGDAWNILAQSTRVPDILAIQQSKNLYVYCINNPVLHVDNSGDFIPPPLIGAGIGFFVGLGGQFVGDLVSSAINGEFSLSGWESYVGAGLGGAAGGALIGSGIIEPHLIGAVAGGTTTLVTESLEYASGKNRDRSVGDIAFDTLWNAGAGALLGGLFSKIKIPQITAGRGNMDAAYRMVLTKLRNGTIKNFTWKTVKNGLLSGFLGGGAESIFGGILGSDLIENFWKFISNSDNESLKDIMQEWLGNNFSSGDH